MNIVEILKEIDIFTSLDDEALAELASRGQVQNLPRNTIFINEGDQSGSLFVILEGRAKVFLSDVEGKELILGIETPGGYTGEIALLDEEPRSASVMTMEKTKVLMLSRDVFQTLIRSNPDFAVGIIRGLTKRMRGLIANVGNLALKSVYRRLIGTLLNMSEPIENHRVIHERRTHQEIADIIGASREMVSRIIKDLTKGGYLVVEGRKLFIVKNLPSGW